MDGPSLAIANKDDSRRLEQPARGRSQILSYFQQLRAQNRLKKALDPFADDLKEVELDFFNYLPETTPSAQKAVAHVAESGGKRIRPAVFFAATRLFSIKSVHFKPISVVCEYVHTASLLHDDVIDSSSLRRGRATVNSLWGDQSSVLVGDLLYARASELMAATGSIEVVSTFARAIRLMSEGELIQLENLFESRSETIYFEIIEKKTASLLSACCKVAGLLSGGSPEEIEALSTFGQNLGFAFQLIDDALDYISLNGQIGKPTLSDLKEGKITYPILALLKMTNESDSELLKTYLATPSDVSQNIGRVLELVQKYQTDRLTVQLAASYTEKAKQSLQLFQKSSGYQDLLNFSESLNFRNF